MQEQIDAMMKIIQRNEKGGMSYDNDFFPVIQIEKQGND